MPLLLPRLPLLRAPLRALTRSFSAPVTKAPAGAAKSETPAAESKDTELTKTQASEIARHQQAPNRLSTWSNSQRPRELGMQGPRFEQTDIEAQPAPWAAIELIHQVPVKWTKERVVACDGGEFLRSKGEGKWMWG